MTKAEREVINAAKAWAAIMNEGDWEEYARKIDRADKKLARAVKKLTKKTKKGK
jgi:hypothetical protein